MRGLQEARPGGKAAVRVGISRTGGESSGLGAAGCVLDGVPQECDFWGVAGARTGISGLEATRSISRELTGVAREDGRRVDRARG